MLVAHGNFRLTDLHYKTTTHFFSCVCVCNTPLLAFSIECLIYPIWHNSLSEKITFYYRTFLFSTEKAPQGFDFISGKGSKTKKANAQKALCIIHNLRSSIRLWFCHCLTGRSGTINKKNKFFLLLLYRFSGGKHGQHSHKKFDIKNGKHRKKPYPASAGRLY